jgi:antitoxin MazE
METAVAKWGNSLALRLPATIAADLRVKEGTPVDIRIEDDTLLVTPSKPKFRLSDLLEGYDRDQHGHGEISTGSPQGNEVW